MGAVGPSPDPVLTVQQRGFRSLTLHIVQEDQAKALAERPIGYDLSATPIDGEEFIAYLLSVITLLDMKTAVLLVEHCKELTGGEIIHL